MVKNIIPPFESTDEFVMAGFNGKIANINDIFNLYGNNYWWKRRSTTFKEVQTDIGAKVYVVRGSDQTTQISDSINIDPDSGAVTLNNPTDYVIKHTASNETTKTVATALTNKAPTYITNIQGNPTAIYYMPEGTNIGTTREADSYTVAYAYSSDSGSVYFSGTADLKVKVITSEAGQGDWEYLNSPDRSAYPDSGVSGGYEYQYLGIPFDNAVNAAKFVFDKYNGDGTYGADNPNSITFDFAPKLVIILCQQYSGGRTQHFFSEGTYQTIVVMDGLTTDYQKGAVPFISNAISSNAAYAKKSEDGKTLTWYNTANANYQLNYSGTTYCYIAIG